MSASERWIQKDKNETGKKETHSNTPILCIHEYISKPNLDRLNSSNEFAAGLDHDRTSYNLSIATNCNSIFSNESVKTINAFPKHAVLMIANKDHRYRNR